MTLPFREVVLHCSRCANGCFVQLSIDGSNVVADALRVVPGKDPLLTERWGRQCRKTNELIGPSYEQARAIILGNRR